jgi:hypothetical protein
VSLRVEFHQPDTPDVVVATVTWDGHAAIAESADDEVAASLRKAFRPTPVIVDEGAYRQQGTRGEVLVAPGTLEWFRAVAQVRAPAETGLAARLVPGVAEGGYDPAAQYRTFEESMERLARPAG